MPHTVIGDFLTRVENVKGDPQLQAALAAEFALTAQAEPERAALRAALDAAALLHWFDAGLLEKMLEISTEEAKERLAALKRLPFVETCRRREAGLSNVHEATRLGWRRQMARENPDGFRGLSLRAAAWFAKDKRPAGRREYIYHLLCGDPKRGAGELKGLHYPYFRPEGDKLLPAVLRELVEDSGLVQEPARTAIFEALERFAKYRAQHVGDYDDMQAILRSGFGSLEEACFLLLRITDKSEAKAWLAAIAGEPGAGRLSYLVTHCGHLSKSRQEQVLQIAFTAQGLLNLGVPKEFFPDDNIQGPASDRIHVFSRDFYLGMTGEYAAKQGRSRRLGDTGKNAPAEWDWGSPGEIPDVLLMLYAERGGLAAFQQIVTADIALGFDIIRVLRAADAPISDDDDKTRREPFGFMDGISQPKVDWDAARRPGSRDDLEYGNLISAGEFLLGYQNEFGLYTRRPLIDPKFDPQNILPPAADHPEKRDLGRNGTYLVFRHLEQDVHAFWQFAYKHSPEDGGIGMAEAMVGRRYTTGDPLVAPSRAEIRGVGTLPAVEIPASERRMNRPTGPEDIRQNGFTFGADPDGLACPFGAHIRRANPRNPDMPGGRGQSFLSWLLRMLGLKQDGPRDDLLSASRFHRIIRRGRPFGAVIDRESALKEEEPGFKSGIYFIALNASISRQFEFIQGAWIMSSKFNGLDRESDPLLGNRGPSPLGYPKQPPPLGYPTDEFSLPQPSGPNRRICGLPQFVTVRGGAYFFLPGLRALRFIARLNAKA